MKIGTCGYLYVQVHVLVYYVTTISLSVCFLTFFHKQYMRMYNTVIIGGFLIDNFYLNYANKFVLSHVMSVLITNIQCNCLCGQFAMILVCMFCLCVVYLKIVF